MRAIRWFGNALTIVALTAAVCHGQDAIPWQPSLEVAQQVAHQTNRLVLIHFWSTSCAPCMRLEKEVFTKPEVGKALESHYVMVKLNVDESPGTARLYGVSSIPTDVITTPGGRLVSQLQSPPSANQYIAQLNQVALGHQELVRRPNQQSPYAQAAGQPGAAPPNTALAPQSVPYGAQSAAIAAPATGFNPAGATPTAYDRYAESARQNPAAMNPGATPPPGAYGAVAVDPAAGYAPQQGAAAYAAGGAMQGNPNLPQQGMMAQAPGAAIATAGAPPAAGAGAYGAQHAYEARASYQPPQPALPQLPPGCPPLALDGNCPVTLLERHVWAMGSVAYGAIHRGRTYLFLGPAEKEKFLASPDAFSPVMSGNDPVLAVDNQMLVPGKREHGVFYDKRVFLFANEATLQRFEQQRARYVAEALQPAGTATIQR